MGESGGFFDFFELVSGRKFGNVARGLLFYFPGVGELLGAQPGAVASEVIPLLLLIEEEVPVGVDDLLQVGPLQVLQRGLAVNHHQHGGLGRH